MQGPGLSEQCAFLYTRGLRPGGQGGMKEFLGDEPWDTRSPLLGEEHSSPYSS